MTSSSPNNNEKATTMAESPPPTTSSTSDTDNKASSQPSSSTASTLSTIISSLSSSSWLSQAWLGLAVYLSLGPLLSLLPVTGGTWGGLFKLILNLMAGPLCLLHVSLLLLVYPIIWRWVDSNHPNQTLQEKMQHPTSQTAYRRRLTRLSTIAALAAALPAAVTLAQHPHATNAISMATWAHPPQVCRPLHEYDNTITTVFRRNQPEIGPYSTDPAPMFSTVSQAIFDSVAPPNDTLPILEATLYPMPKENDKNNSQNRQPGLLIFLHGGGWWTGRRDLDPLPCYVEQAHTTWNNYHVAALDYRLGRHGWAGREQLDDVLAGIRHLLQHYSKIIDPTRIVLIGNSAGAHLALLAAYSMPGPIAAVVATSPSTSVRIGTDPATAHTSFYTGSWKEAAATERLCAGFVDHDDTLDLDACHEALSPVAKLEQLFQQHKKTHIPKTLLSHGTMDEYYPVAHARALRDVFAQYKQQSLLTYLEFPFTSHAFEVATPSLQSQITFGAIGKLLLEL